MKDLIWKHLEDWIFSYDWASNLLFPLLVAFIVGIISVLLKKRNNVNSCLILFHGQISAILKKTFLPRWT